MQEGGKRSEPLSAEQQKFAKLVASGLPQRAALYQSYPETKKGQENSRLRVLALNPKVQAEVARERERWEKANLMTKKRVMDGFLEAIDIAKIQADPMAMIGGWREIAKMCGYFEPIKHRLEVSVQGEVVIQKLQALSDAQLLELADGKADALEGEFTVLPPPEPPSD